MTTSALPVPPSHAVGGPAARVAPRAVQRVLGALGVLGAPVFLGQWAAAGFGAPPVGAAPTLAGSLLNLAYLAGFAASAIGLRHLRATGRGRGAAALTAVQAVALVLAASQEVQDLTGARPLGAVGYHAADVAWPLSHVLMLAVGVAVLRAGVWRGWRRRTPLACGLVLPLAIAAAAVGGRVAMGWVFCPGTTLAFAALGVAVATAPAGSARPTLDARPDDR